MSKPEEYASRYYLEHPTLDNTRGDLIELFRLAMMAAKAEERQECAQIVEARIELFTRYGSGLTGRNALKEASNSILRRGEPQ